VRQYLIAAGVKENRLVATGYGESQPLEPGTSRAARARNRRVDFIILRPFSISANIGFVQSIPSGVEGTAGGVGFLIGAMAHYSISDRIELQGGINYLNRTATVDDFWEVSIGYLDVPITAHYILPALAGKMYPFVGAGLSVGIPISDKGDGSSNSSEILPSIVVETGTTYETPIGLIRGQLRYSQALSAVVDDLKISTIDLQVGYVF
jgi:hypothetical protein